MNNNSNIFDSIIEPKEEKINERKLKAIEKIEKESQSVSGNNVPAIGIYNYIKMKCLSDEAFSERVLIETKTLSKCFDYILNIAFSKAKKQHQFTNKNEVGIGMSSNEIFSLCDDYFLLDDEALIIEETKTKAEPIPPQKTKKAEKCKQKKNENDDNSATQISLFE